MARFTPIQIQGRDGRPYNGAWEPLDDGAIEVSSAYGSRVVRAGKADPDKAARAALEEIVAAWLPGRNPAR